MTYETLLYAVDGPVATVTLNRPEQLNTIVPPLPDEVEAAVTEAVRDASVKVIVVRGAGRAFSAGYDFRGGFHHWDEQLTTEGEWDPGKDFALAVAPAVSPTHSRMWGAYLSGMWIYRLGLAKEHALLGRPLSGRQAADVELINEAVPFDRLEATVAERAAELASIPSSQLAAMKLCVNHAYEQMGLGAVQTLGPILDGLMRNTPDAKDFIALAERDGVGAAVAQRDAIFGDYSQAAPEDKPDPRNVIEP